MFGNVRLAFVKFLLENFAFGRKDIYVCIDNDTDVYVCVDGGDTADPNGGTRIRCP